MSVPGSTREPDDPEEPFTAAPPTAAAGADPVGHPPRGAIHLDPFGGPGPAVDEDDDLDEAAAAIARLNRRAQRERAARLEAEAIAERRTRELWDGQLALSLLAATATAANRADSLGDGVAAVLGEIGAFLDAEAGAAWLIVDDALQPMGITWQADHVDEPIAHHLAERHLHEAGLEHRAASRGSIEYAANLRHEPEEWLAALQSRTGWALALPFGLTDSAHQGTWRGVLGLYHRSPGVLDEEDLRVATQAAHHLGNLLLRVEGATRLRVANEELDARVEQRTAELRRAQLVAEAADRTKTAFLANLSHEIRTPLARIIGMLELIGPEHLPPAEAEYLHTTQDAAAELQRLFDALLDLADLERGLVDAAAVPVTPSALFEPVIERWRRDAAGQGLLLLADTADNEPVWIDPDLVTRATQALVDNAVKFGGSGTIEVSARVEPATPGTPAQLRVRVTDHGPGFPADKVDLVFEPFQQLDAGSDRRHGGVGIGLTLFRRVVDQLDGTIGVETEPGHGATFWFTVPSARPDGA